MVGTTGIGLAAAAARPWRPRPPSPSLSPPSPPPPRSPCRTRRASIPARRSSGNYAQTKAATTNFVRSLAKQLAPKGIRVNGVAPGPIWTPLQVSGGASPEKLEKFGGQTPMGRPGQPAKLASIYVQLAAADASYATGQVYGSSGGAGLP